MFSNLNENIIKNSKNCFKMSSYNYKTKGDFLFYQPIALPILTESMVTSGLNCFLALS